MMKEYQKNASFVKITNQVDKNITPYGFITSGRQPYAAKFYTNKLILWYVVEVHGKIYLSLTQKYRHVQLHYTFCKVLALTNSTLR